MTAFGTCFGALLSFLGLIFFLKYKKWSKEKTLTQVAEEADKKRKFEAEETEKNHKRELEKSLWNTLLSNSTLDNFDLKKIEELRNLILDVSSEVKNDAKDANGGNLVKELEKIKKTNESLKNKNIDEEQ